MTTQWRNYWGNYQKICLVKFFLKLLDQQYHKGYLSNFSTELSSQIFDCSQYLTLNHTCGEGVTHRDDMIVFNERVCQHQCVFVCYILCL